MKPEATSNLREEGRRQRQEKAGSVARLVVGSDRTPVPHPAECIERHVDQGAAGPTVGIGDEANAAGITLVLRVIKTLTSPSQDLPHRLPVFKQAYADRAHGSALCNDIPLKAKANPTRVSTDDCAES
jgi:hypothetical protein